MNENQAPAGPKESDIAANAAKKRKPVFDPTGRIEQINAEETKIADVRRHPFGLFVIHSQVIVGLVISLFLIFTLLPSGLQTLGLEHSGAASLAVVFGLVAVVLGLVFLVLATRIYMGNQLIITSNNITQVLQIGLFNRKVSELSMANIEDVTAQQHGIFATMFNFGVLRMETAGEQNNFVFPYCPNPNAYAKTLLDARAEYLKHHNIIH
jgi:uncharacterized membrane protein YdbT with pleckstrin-like domain